MTAGDGGEARESICGEEVMEERQGDGGTGSVTGASERKRRITGGRNCTVRNRCRRKCRFFYWVRVGLF
jgi:hypothetical protein